ncbi:hypothetical protein ACCAA_1230004 [Candidatus Accumulibacter aalborgensis]|uniref:Uncharacterized protein n=1 Tax=Candidatus Accumulibacter aalborgensis TaxID=1860102 RepID=A0A1A8XFK7_9PROT|nr:hypothetical protein [Candidatus Accumulibacter aalborgensis]SBT03964.1 hypothetical protein ACCAA_1230004 [Candidatus Accumulibacter aalborgensis]
MPWPGQALGLLAVVLERGQFGGVFVLSIGEACHVATTAPASGSARWRSPASGARLKAGQRTGGRSGVPWPGRVSGCRQESLAASGAGSLALIVGKLAVLWSRACSSSAVRRGLRLPDR